MPLAMIRGGAVLFAHVPRCAGTAVERYLEHVFGPLAMLDRAFIAQSPEKRWTRTSPQHADAASLARLFPPGFLRATFAMVRHPIQRIVSVYGHQQRIEGLIAPDITLEAWLNTLRAPGACKAMYDNHTRPMSEMIPKDARVFRLEDGWSAVIDWLQELAGPDVALPREVPAMNVLSRRLASAGKADDPVEITANAVSLIGSLYAEDFSRFGYALPRTVTETEDSRAVGFRSDVVHSSLVASEADGDPLYIIADDERINAHRVGADAWQCIVPTAIRSLRLCRRFTRFAMIGGTGTQPVPELCVSSIEVENADGKFKIALDHPALKGEFQEIGLDGARIWRWTDGDATIPVELLGNLRRPALLTIRGSADPRRTPGGGSNTSGPPRGDRRR